MGYWKELSTDGGKVIISAVEYRTADELAQGQQPELAHVQVVTSTTAFSSTAGFAGSKGVAPCNAPPRGGIRRQSLAGHGRSSVKTAAQRNRMSSLGAFSAPHNTTPFGGRDNLQENPDDDYNQDIFTHPDDLLPSFSTSNLHYEMRAVQEHTPLPLQSAAPAPARPGKKTRGMGGSPPTLPVRRRAATASAGSRLQARQPEPTQQRRPQPQQPQQQTPKLRSHLPSSMVANPLRGDVGGGPQSPRRVAQSRPFSVATDAPSYEFVELIGPNTVAGGAAARPAELSNYSFVELFGPDAGQASSRLRNESYDAAVVVDVAPPMANASVRAPSIHLASGGGGGGGRGEGEGNLQSWWCNAPGAAKLLLPSTDKPFSRNGSVRMYESDDYARLQASHSHYEKEEAGNGGGYLTVGGVDGSDGSGGVSSLVSSFAYSYSESAEGLFTKEAELPSILLELECPSAHVAIGSLSGQDRQHLEREVLSLMRRAGVAKEQVVYIDHAAGGSNSIAIGFALLGSNLAGMLLAGEKGIAKKRKQQQQSRFSAAELADAIGLSCMQQISLPECAAIFSIAKAVLTLPAAFSNGSGGGGGEGGGAHNHDGAELTSHETTL